MKTINFIILISLTSFLLTGCMTAGRHTLPQNGSMTMSDIYQHETGLVNGFDYQGDSKPERTRNNLIRLTRDYYASNDKPNVRITRLFRQLPNPEIPMYVYPHLVRENGESQPVPGYTTAFFLYKQSHFAMPSEDYAG